MSDLPTAVPAAPGGISESERQEILTQIDERVRRSRTAGPNEGAAYRPRSQGILLPILVNLAALLVIGLAAVALPLLFNRSERTITARPTYVPTGETTIVGAVRREAEQALAGKDQTIAGIQTQLGDLSAEIAGLRANRDAEIARREDELRAGLSAELEAEKKRLQESGVGSVDAKLKAFEREKQAELEKTLAEFRASKDAELAQKEREYDSRFLDLQTDLDRARQERTALQSQLQQAQASTTRAQDELAAAADRTAREQLALDQLSAAYLAVGDALKAGRAEEALRNVDGVASFLAQPAIAALPAVVRRRAVDAFLIESLRRLARADLSPSAAGPLQEAAALVAQAEEKLGAGDAAGARSLYRSAIERIPALQTAYDRLVEIEARSATASRQAVAEAIADADAQYAKANWKAALDRYDRALDLLEKEIKGIGRASGRIADAGYRQAAADAASRQDRAARQLADRGDTALRRGGLDDALTAYASVLDSYPLAGEQVKRAVSGIESVIDAKILQAEASIAAREKAREAERAALKTLSEDLAAAARKAGTSADAARRELISLLQAKIAVKEVLTSEAVRVAHPGLSDSLDHYIELYGEQKRGEGRTGALADLASVADVLLGRTPQAEMTSVWARYLEEAQRAALQAVLDRLDRLLQ